MCKLVFHVNQSCVNWNSQWKWGWIFLGAATCYSQAVLSGLQNLLQTPVPPALISRTVSVDVKHHVYLPVPHSVCLSSLLNIYQTPVPHSVSLSCLLNIYQTPVPHSVSLSCLLNTYQTPVPHSVSLSSNVSKDKTAPYTVQQLQLTPLAVHREVLANSQQVPIPHSTFSAHSVLTLQNSSPRTLLAEFQVPVNS